MHVGIAGTFDLENYGDLLFPLIAEAELTRRIGAVELSRFSYFRRSPPAWPYEVREVAELPGLAGALDAMLIGGGHVIRFDKDIAPGYAPPDSDIHHPCGYWLSPALVAAQHGCPVVWNAPGVAGRIPEWAEPLVRLALEASKYVAVRDEPSRQALLPLAGATGIAVVPDTCFGVARLLAARGPSAELGELRRSLGLTQPFIVVQAGDGMEAFCRMVRQDPEPFAGHRLVALEAGPVLGDDGARLAAELPGVVRLPGWPHPLVIAELIQEAVAVVGVSLHMAITALVSGVPVFRPSHETGGKYAVLSEFESVHSFDSGTRLDPDWFRSKLGRDEPEPKARASAARGVDHWDRVASVVMDNDRSATRGLVGRFWQSHPLWLEARALERRAITDAVAAEREQVRRLQAAVAERDERIQALHAAVAERDERIEVLHAAVAERDRRIRAEAAAREGQLREFHDSASWRLTAPVRWIDRRLRPRESGPVMDLRRFARQKMATVPYGWAFVNEVFPRRHAHALVASYPRDRFKTVQGYDGEKGYEYEARALIHLGAGAVASPAGLSQAWRELAGELLSPGYRAAMTRLTGCDLTTAPMEAYVCHFGPGAWLGPHVDLKAKIVTHVFYFNASWDREDGGCLHVLGSSAMSDVVAVVEPIAGNSSVIVRSDRSWHAVSRVADGCRRSRRSMNVIFYHPGATSTMWPPGESAALHVYEPPE